MKKAITAILILMATKSIAQPYIGLNVSTHGVGAETGFITAKGLQMALGGSVPLIKSDVPRILYLTAGQKINVGEYNVTPSAGIGYYSVKDFSEYDKGGSVITLSGYKPFYNLELGRDWYKGRLFVFSNYGYKFSAGVGIKVLFKHS